MPRRRWTASRCVPATRCCSPRATGPSGTTTRRATPRVSPGRARRWPTGSSRTGARSPAATPGATAPTPPRTRTPRSSCRRRSTPVTGSWWWRTCGWPVSWPPVSPSSCWCSRTPSCAARPARGSRRWRWCEVTGTLTGLVRLVRLVTADAHEGPSWFADEDALYVTTTRGPHGTAILRIALDGLLPVGPHAVTVLRADATVANGTAADAAGRLIVCEQGSRTTPARIAAVDRATGAATTLVDSYRGLPLNSPNDGVVRRDGTVCFPVPAYGAAQGFREPARLPDQVYRLDPATGGLTVVATGFDHPNGLAFDPDERVLYVADSGADRGDGRFEPDRPHEVLAFPVLGDRLGPRRRLPGLPRPA